MEIKIQNVSMTYPSGKQALKGLNLELKSPSLIGLLGPNGAGKSTLMKLLVAALQPTGGNILLNGVPLAKVESHLKASLGYLPQDFGLFDELTVTQFLDYMAALKGIANPKAAIQKTIQAVNLEEKAKSKIRTLSGGQRQRVMIAMALSCDPKLLIADEPTTALDVTIQAQILRLMGDLRRDHGTAILLITHNMGVVAQLCDYVYVMYAGQIVEAAETFALFRAPRHPYTQGLLKAIPSLEGTADRLYTIRGSVPDPRCPLPGCRFCPRCDQSRQDCARQVPDLRALAAGHWVRCCHIS